MTTKRTKDLKKALIQNNATEKKMPPLVGLIVNSRHDWDILQSAELTLRILGIPCEVKVISAESTPNLLTQYAKTAEERGLEVIIAGASEAAHLPAMLAAHTLIPMLGVPIPSSALNGLDSLLSMVQMPAGVPVGTLGLGRSGAINAALLAAQIIGCKNPRVREAVLEYRAGQTKKILDNPDPRRIIQTND